MAEVPEIDVTALEELLEEAFLVDVREPDEYEDAHVPGAILIPLSTVPGSLALLPSEGTIHVICAAGSRSARAVEFLLGNGFDAVNIAGGTMAWIQSGAPTVSGPDPV